MVGPPEYRAILCTKDQNPSLVDGLQQFRKRLFVDRLGWRLSIKDDREFDQFDTDQAVHCAIFQRDKLIGGFRAIQTIHPYLAQSVFPHLSTLRAFPSRRDVWEISRFGVFSTRSRLESARINYGVMFRFAQDRRASALVAVVDTAHERLLSVVGIRTRRYGPPQMIGTDLSGRPIEVVAGEIPLAEQRGERFRTLLSLAQQVEVDDETLVLGRSRISA